MKFLIDAQLPPSLATLLKDKGHDAIHTLSLPEKNLTSDQTINKISIKEERILISKDSDFYHSFLLKREPYKVLLVRVGNLSKNNLNNLIVDNLEIIVNYFQIGSMVEITQNSIKLLY